MSNPDNFTPQEIVDGVREFFLFLEECDSQVCDYSDAVLKAGSVVLYEFGNNK